MKIVVYAEGLCTASVCAPKEMSKEEVEAEMPGTGIRSQWMVSDQPLLVVSLIPVPGVLMKIYIAASSREMERAEAAMNYARSRGHTIGFDWTVGLKENIAKGISDAELDDLSARKYARKDRDGIAHSDALLFLSPTKPTKGAWWELGFAHGLWYCRQKIRIGVSYLPGEPRQCIFEELETICYTGDEDAIQILEKMVAE